MSLFGLSIKLLRRDWRAGEWRVLMLALVLAVGSLATVGMFADRVRQALQQEATSLIGADLRITSTRPLPVSYRAIAEKQGLQTTASRSFPSMVSSSEQALLSEILAVEDGYPLRGRITLNDGAEYFAQGIPASGTVWSDERLLSRLGLHVGDTVAIGAMRFRIAARIVKDIDQSIGFSSFAPRGLINARDLHATGLLQEGSRVAHRLMVAGEAKRVEAFREELTAKLSANEKLEDVRDARPEIRNALERAENFLGLAALSSAILAGAAILLAARRFVQRHLDGCAVMRCLGAQQGQVLRLFLYQFLLLGLLGATLGCLLGYATQAVLVASIESLHSAMLPQPSWLPALKAVASGYALLLGFGFLPLLQLRRVSPLRVLRRELGMPQPNMVLAWVLAVAVLALLFLWQAGSLKLGLAVLGGLLAALAVFGLLAWVALRLGYIAIRMRAHSGYGHWRHALNNLMRYGRNNVLQVVALSLGGMSLLVLTLVRADLLQGWQERLPEDAPNRFLVNVQPDQRQPVRDFFVRAGLPSPELLPMVRGRLVGINGVAVNGDSYADGRASHLVEREFNLSWLDRMPDWNELVAGKWWGSADAAELSVEEGIAKTLGIRLGDTLTYDVAGTRFDARVTSLRKVQWDSMRVNFFVIASPGVLRDFPASYLASFYLPPAKRAAGDALVRDFPNLLVIDTGAILDQVRSIMDQIAQVMGAVFLFTLFSGLAVLYAAMLATQDERGFEAAVLRTLGADGRYLRKLHLAEFAVLGGMSGLFASVGAVSLGWVLAQRVLDIPYSPDAAIWPVGIGTGMLVVMFAGWMGTRRLSRQSPMAILRDRV